MKHKSINNFLISWWINFNKGISSSWSCNHFTSVWGKAMNRFILFCEMTSVLGNTLPFSNIPLFNSTIVTWRKKLNIIWKHDQTRNTISMSYKIMCHSVIIKNTNVSILMSRSEETWKTYHFVHWSLNCIKFKSCWYFTSLFIKNSYLMSF